MRAYLALAFLWPCDQPRGADALTSVHHNGVVLQAGEGTREQHITAASWQSIFANQTAAAQAALALSGIVSSQTAQLSSQRALIEGLAARVATLEAGASASAVAADALTGRVGALETGLDFTYTCETTLTISPTWQTVCLNSNAGVLGPGSYIVQVNHLPYPCTRRLALWADISSRARLESQLLWMSQGRILQPSVASREHGLQRALW
jgi:hypothetical protein